MVSGVACDRDGGLPVDEQLRVASVWAAGDVARYREPHTRPRLRIEHWRLAEQHGRAAAGHGRRAEPFAGVPPLWTQHFELELGYAGAGQGWKETVVRRACGAQLTAYVADGTLLAAAGTQGAELGALMSSCASAACRPPARSAVAASRPAEEARPG